MNKRLPIAAAFIFSVSMLLSGCNSEEPPSELDSLIEQLQTMHITSETIPEETSDDVSVSENTSEPVTAEATGETASGDNSPVTYNSITVTVLSVEEGHIAVEYNGVVYNIIIDESTGIFGGDISENKTVTITYVRNDNDSETGILASAITVLP